VDDTTYTTLPRCARAPVPLNAPPQIVLNLPVDKTNYRTLVRWARSFVPLQAPHPSSVNPTVMLADDGVKTTSHKVMGATNDPAAERLPICSSPLGRVLQCKNVMDMVLGRRAVSLWTMTVITHLMLIGPIPILC